MAALGKTIKGHIIAHVLKDLFYKKAEEAYEELRGEITALVLQDLEENNVPVEELKKLEPWVGFSSEVNLENVVSNDVARRTDNFDRGMKYAMGITNLNIWHFSIKKSIPYMSNTGCYQLYKHKDKFTIAVKDYNAKILPFLEYADNLASVVRSCNTAKQLAETCPELIRYIPPENKDFLLPVAIETLNKVRGVLQAQEEKAV
ncbi:MAG: hypothetical protein LBI67_05585 [Treponema sp.]|jgi:hypothetical protein|nr:hypothetical protein [Treponema sp.]